jgi:hypothetical protein
LVALVELALVAGVVTVLLTAGVAVFVTASAGAAEAALRATAFFAVAVLFCFVTRGDAELGFWITGRGFTKRCFAGFVVVLLAVAMSIPHLKVCDLRMSRTVVLERRVWPERLLIHEGFQLVKADRPIIRAGNDHVAVVDANVDRFAKRREGSMRVPKDVPNTA